MGDPVVRFDRQSCLNLGSFERSSRSVMTPVWFVQDGPAEYVCTSPESGKVMCVRNDRRARVVLSAAQDNPIGVRVNGSARLMEADGAARVDRMAMPKCGVMKVGFDRMSCLQVRHWATIHVDLPMEARR